MLSHPTLSTANPVHIRADAHHMADGAQAFSEERWRTLQGTQRVRDSVVYRTPDGSPLGSKIVQYGAGYATRIRLRQIRPEFHLDVDIQGDSLAQIVFLRGGKTTRHTVSLPRGTVSDAGFDLFIRDNIAALAQGRSVDFPFLVPEHGRVYSMRLVPQEGAPVGQIRVRLQPASAILRLFADGVVATYTLAGALVSYEGVADLKAGKDNFKVRMRYWEP